MISDIVRISYGGKPISVPMPYALRGLYVFQDIYIPKYNLFIIVVSVIITIFLYLILYKTKVGIAIRACAIDSEMTSSAGVDVPKVYLLVFMAGVGLAGMASVTAGPIVAGLLGMDLTMIIVAFCIVIIGGVGNIGGTLATALIVGIVEALGILLLPEFAEIFVYIIVVIVLIFRPSGLFAKAGV
jgi:branched-subunit amino acid ABC-type transport system permease component